MEEEERVEGRLVFLLHWFVCLFVYVLGFIFLAAAIKKTQKSRVGIPVQRAKHRVKGRRRPAAGMNADAYVFI